MTDQPPQPAFNPNWRNPVHVLALGLGSGASPFAPGTMGTLAALPFAWLLGHLSLLPYLAITAVCFVLGIYLCDRTAKDLGVHDHPAIVWDEFVGLFVTLIAIAPTWLNLLLGFILFRVFDILKPWPIGWLDRQVEGGFGIMLDDLLAGVYAWLALQLILRYLLP